MVKIKKVLIDSFVGNNVVVCSTQLPGNGGSATNAYNIHNMLCQLGFNSVCIFIEDESNICDFNYDNLKNIYVLQKSISCEIKTSDVLKKFEKIMDKHFKGLPSVFYCKNYFAPTYIKNMINSSSYDLNLTKIAYLIAGSRGFTDLLEKNVIPFYSKECEDLCQDLWCEKQELTSIDNCDYIFSNSKTCYDAFKRFCPVTHVNKHCCQLYTSLATYELLKSDKTIKFDNKEIDIIFIVSNTNRKIKNSNFAINLLNNEKLRKYKKVVIGDYSFTKKNSSSNIIFLESVDNNDVIKYLKKSKILINTSLFEAFPNTCLEAIASNCNVICSKNCGGMNEFLHHDNVLNLTNQNSWIDRIEQILNECRFITEFNNNNNICEDIMLKTYKIYKQISSEKISDLLDKKKSIISINYTLLKDINSGDKWDEFKQLTTDKCLYTTEFYRKINEKYIGQQVKMTMFLENFNTYLCDYIDYDTKLENIDLITDLPNINKVSSALRKKIFSISDNINISDIDKKHNLVFVIFKKPLFSYYEKLINNNKQIIDLSSGSIIV